MFDDDFGLSQELQEYAKIEGMHPEELYARMYGVGDAAEISPFGSDGQALLDDLQKEHGLKDADALSALQEALNMIHHPESAQVGLNAGDTFKDNTSLLLQELENKGFIAFSGGSYNTEKLETLIEKLEQKFSETPQSVPETPQPDIQSSSITAAEADNLWHEFAAADAALSPSEPKASSPIEDIVTKELALNSSVKPFSDSERLEFYNEMKDLMLSNTAITSARAHSPGIDPVELQNVYTNSVYTYLKSDEIQPGGLSQLTAEQKDEYMEAFLSIAVERINNKAA